MADSELKSASDRSRGMAKKKRGSSGLANLQKARLKKILRRERMKNLLKKRSTPKPTNGVKIQQKPVEEAETEFDIEADYFLGSRRRKLTDEESLIVPLRDTDLLKLHVGGSILRKEPPASIRDQAKYPTFHIIRQIEGINSKEKNPLHWTTDETFQFIKHISPVKSVAKSFHSEEIDGEAMINLTARDLVDHFHLDSSTSEALLSTFAQLRKEIIQRFVNA